MGYSHMGLFTAVHSSLSSLFLAPCFINYDIAGNYVPFASSGRATRRRDEHTLLAVKRSGNVSQLFRKCPQDVRILSQVNKGKSTAFLGFLSREEISSLFDR